MVLLQGTRYDSKHVYIVTRDLNLPKRRYKCHHPHSLRFLQNCGLHQPHRFWSEIAPQRLHPSRRLGHQLQLPPHQRFLVRVFLVVGHRNAVDPRALKMAWVAGQLVCLHK